jgi:hypothetical protein
MGQQNPQPSALQGCVVLALLGLIFGCCFIRIPSPPSKPTPETSKLTPEELYEHRETFNIFVAPNLNKYRMLFQNNLGLWQWIFDDLTRKRISRAKAYEWLSRLEKPVKALQTPSWTVPDSLPQDVYKLLQQARTHYIKAATSFLSAIQHAKEYLETRSTKAHTQANESMKSVKEFIARAEKAIAEAKKKLGF